MKYVRKIVLLVAVIICSCASVYGYGLYNWYGGYNTASAVGWNGGSSVSWSYAPTGWNWWWGGSAYASAYASTYPSVQWNTSYGWSGAYAQAHTSAPVGRSADAWAYAYSAAWPWWNSGGYVYAKAQTTGSPSYASAYARAQSGWWYRFWIPRQWWYGVWLPIWGWRIPFYFYWWYWGWFDGEMGVETDLYVYDLTDESSQTLLEDGFVDNGDGTYDQLGTTFNPSDLAYNPDVDGSDHPGWDIMNHNGEDGDDPMEIPFLVSVYEGSGGDDEYIELFAVFDIDGYIGQPIPEPLTVILFFAGSLSLIIRYRFKKM